MMNLTQVTYFTLAGYFDTKVFKHLLFLILLCLYVLIIVSNVLLIVVICMTRSLHEPMYLFLCSLFVNELYGSTGLFPFLLLHVLSDVHTVSLSLCFLQIYCLYSYATIEFFTLAIMSYDRFLAICYPLQYSTRMTFNRIAILIAVTWLLALFIMCYTMLLTSSLQLCGNIINKVYCDNYYIVKLSCGDTTVNNICGLIGTVVTVFVPLTLIMFSYMKILKVCFSGCKQTRQKAVSTCTPHLASLLNFSFGVCFEIFHSRFDMSSAPNTLRIFLSLYFLTCQPLFNPLIYGLRLSKIHHVCKRLLRSDM
ncbi:olfactory receptor 11A1-like [Solea senegalensis]|uniref:Olfactory receptor 11A1-like n=1 Tax=Solea senegalensis TaxID=28829 RepID=A0AAV6PG88_SOLSE|nr:olfactory receptor 11A1-like [Solea senegalensis]